MINQIDDLDDLDAGGGGGGGGEEGGGGCDVLNSSPSLSSEKRSLPTFSQIFQRGSSANTIHCVKCHPCSHKLCCVSAAAAAVTGNCKSNINNNALTSSAVTDVDDQEFYENAAGILSNSIEDKRYSQSDEEEGYRNSKEIRHLLCSCWKEAQSAGIYDPTKLTRNYTDKTISTCVSYKSGANRNSNNANMNHSSNHLNLRNSSQINSYLSHLNNNMSSSQSPQDTSPLDSAILTNQLQNAKLSIDNIDNYPENTSKCFCSLHISTSPHSQQKYSERVQSTKNNEMERFAAQNSPYRINNGNPYYLNNGMPIQNQQYLDKNYSQHENNYNQPSFSSSAYGNNNFAIESNNLHKIKEEAESDTYSIYSYSARFRHTPPEQNDYRKVSSNKSIQSKIQIARNLLRLQQNNNSINSQRPYESLSSKNQKDEKHSLGTGGGGIEDNIWFYISEEKQQSHPTQTDQQKINQIQSFQSPNEKSVKSNGLANEGVKQNKMGYSISSISKNEDNQDGRTTQNENGENNSKIGQSITQKLQKDKISKQNSDNKFELDCSNQTEQYCENKTDCSQKIKEEQQKQQEQPYNLVDLNTIQQISQQIPINNQNSIQIDNQQERNIPIFGQKECKKPFYNSDTNYLVKEEYLHKKSILNEDNEQNQQIRKGNSKIDKGNDLQVTDEQISKRKKIEIRQSQLNSFTNSSIKEKDLQEDQIACDNASDESLPPQLAQSTSSLLKKHNLFLRQLSADETTWQDSENEYENIKRYVITTSLKLLERKTLAQKFPIFQRIDQNIPDKQSFAALTQIQCNTSKSKMSQDSQFFTSLIRGGLQSFSPSSPNEISHNLIQKSNYQNLQQQTGQSNIQNRGYSQRFSLGSPTSYITNLDNMIYHIFSTPQKSLSDVLRDIDSQDMICAEFLSKKIPGLIDRWKKKYVCLYLDRLCYQEQKTSPISTISFKHFDVSILKDNFRNTFTLIDQNAKKKFTFRCFDAEQNKFWIQTIADVIIFNQMYPKYNLYQENTLFYAKKQVCFPHDIQSTLFTGDLIIYRTINSKTQKPEKKQEIAFVIRTQYMLQICYHSEEEGILTYPFDTFIMLHNLASFRRFVRQIDTDDGKSDENLTSLCVSFISENTMRKFKDSNTLVYELLKICNIIKGKTSNKIVYQKEIYETNKLNLYIENCSYSDMVYLVLKSHINTVSSNPQLLNSIFVDYSQGFGNENGQGCLAAKIIIDSNSPNSMNSNNGNKSQLKHTPHCYSMFNQQEIHHDDIYDEERSNTSRLFGRFSYIQYGQDCISNTYRASSTKYL